jgi:hypothetical protein
MERREKRKRKKEREEERQKGRVTGRAKKSRKEKICSGNMQRCKQQKQNIIKTS